MSDAEAAFANIIAHSTPEIASRLRAIRDAASDDEQRRAVAEALLVWGAGGARLLETIPNLSELARPTNVLLELLRGEIKTNRADELRRRAELGRQIIDLASSGMREVPLLLRSFAAEALLQIGGRDCELVPPEEGKHARDILSDALVEARERGFEDLETHIGSVLKIFADPEPADRMVAHERPSVPRTAAGWAGLKADVLFGELSVLMRAEPTPDILDAVAQLATTSSGLVDEVGASLSLPYISALHLGQNGRQEEAKRLLRTVVTKAAAATFSKAPQLCAEAAIALASLLIASGDPAGAIEALQPRLAYLESVYVSATVLSETADSARQLAHAGELLFESYALSGDWPATFDLLDRLKSSQVRHRRALRRHAEGRELLKLERQLFVAARGATPPLGNPRADMFAAKVPAQETLRQRIQEMRSKIQVSLRKRTSQDEIAGALKTNEAVLTIGVGELRTVVFLVAGSTGSTPRMLCWNLEDWSLSRWRALLDDWLVSLIIGVPNGQSLDAVMRQVDIAFGKKIRKAIKEWGIGRLYVVSHRDLVSIPFWALPSLRNVDVVMVESVASLADMLAETPRLLGGKALIVSDPTGDLPIAGLQATDIGDLLADRAFETDTLAGMAATRAEFVDAITQTNLLHFVGHGRRDVLRSESSALMLTARGGAMWLSMGPLLDLLDGWTSERDGARSRVVDDIGRITEWQRDGRTERLIETNIETFFGSWEGHSLRFASELLTAEELAVTPGLDRCALVILIACETGPFFRSSFVDEPSGLVQALQLAGARTVIATAWPVRELSTLLFAELLYAELFSGDSEADVGRALRVAADRLRRMSRVTAAKGLDRLSGRFKGGNAFRLRALAHRVAQGPPRPFSHPLHWASFFIAGAPLVRRGAGQREGGERAIHDA